MKKNEKLFNKSLRVLIVVLLVLSLFNREKSQKLMLAAVVIWLAAIALFYLRRFYKEKAGTAAKKQEPNPVRDKITLFLDSLEDRMKEAGAVHEPIRKEANNFSETELSRMLQHIELRISDKLKSAYANAVWQWCKEPNLREILAGETVRITVENMDCYTHADVTFDRFGRIHVEPMTIGQFSMENSTTTSEPPETEPKAEPNVVDVRVWYELIGQKLLTEQITELNAKGHTKLTVMENGDITIKNQTKNVLQATLDGFPAKNYWQELISILAEDQLAAKITGDCLQIAWN